MFPDKVLILFGDRRPENVPKKLLLFFIEAQYSPSSYQHLEFHINEPTLWFPDEITPDQVLRHHRSAKGRHGGTGTVTSFIRTSILNFISREKEFYRADFLLYFFPEQGEFVGQKNYSCEKGEIIFPKIITLLFSKIKL